MALGLLLVMLTYGVTSAWVSTPAAYALVLGGSVHMTQDTCGKKFLPNLLSAVLACFMRLQKEF